MILKNLIIRPGVHLTPSIARTIELMDRFFDGEPSEVTSGLRTEQDQLKIIIQKLIRHGKDHEFVEFINGIENHWPIDKTVHLGDINRDLFWWQRAWSRLLNISDIVNPPVPAEVVFDYIRPGDLRNKKGEIIYRSNHAHGKAFDIGGDQNITEKGKRVVAALQSGECFIRSWLLERTNNACHIDTEQIGGPTG